MDSSNLFGQIEDWINYDKLKNGRSQLLFLQVESLKYKTLKIDGTKMQLIQLTKMLYRVFFL